MGKDPYTSLKGCLWGIGTSFGCVVNLFELASFLFLLMLLDVGYCLSLRQVWIRNLRFWKCDSRAPCHVNTRKPQLITQFLARQNILLMLSMLSSSYSKNILFPLKPKIIEVMSMSPMHMFVNLVVRYSSVSCFAEEVHSEEKI